MGSGGGGGCYALPQLVIASVFFFVLIIMGCSLLLGNFLFIVLILEPGIITDLTVLFAAWEPR